MYVLYHVTLLKWSPKSFFVNFFDLVSFFFFLEFVKHIKMTFHQIMAIIWWNGLVIFNRKPELYPWNKHNKRVKMALYLGMARGDSNAMWYMVNNHN